MRNQIKLLLTILLLLACAKIPILKIDFAPEESVTPGRQLAFDISRMYHQVTTHPDIDGYPTISPDGKWLAFASRRSGNMDIWIKPVKGGSAIQITNHRADDLMPSWAPDGKKIAFVSYQEDAAGDLWIVSIKKSDDGFSVGDKPKKLTDYQGMDVSPAFSPDGKYIAFTSDRDGEPNIYLYQLKKKKIFQITQQGGQNPSWSSEGNQLAFVSFSSNPLHHGQIFYANLALGSNVSIVTSIIPVTSGESNDAFPCWSPVRDEIFITRYDHDTNQDGKITPDDKPELWKIILNQKNLARVDDKHLQEAKVEPSIILQEPIKDSFQEIQLIPSISYDYFPVCSKDSLLYFVSNRSGNNDIWSIPANGVIPRQTDGFMQYQFALNYFPLVSSDLVFIPEKGSIDNEMLWDRLLAFQRVIDFYSAETNWMGWSLYEIARTHIALHQIDFARAYLIEVVNQFTHFPSLPGHSALQLFVLNFQQNLDSLNHQIEDLSQIRSRFQGDPEIEAEAQLLTGEVYYLYNHHAQALQALEKLITNYPDQTDKCARAQILIGNIYAKFGQTEEVINAFLRVIENYPSQETWVDSALSRILALEYSDDFYSLLSKYRNVIARYAPYHRLVARVQLKIGKQFFQRTDYDAAIEELLLVSKNYPDQRAEVAQAELLLAKVFYHKGEDLRAINQYKKVIQEFGDVLSGLYVVQAKEELLALYLETARQFQLAGELQAAYLRYRDAITIFPRSLEAHRGLVATMYNLGKIDQAIELYHNLQSQHSDDEVVLYVSGLCYSYKATELSDKTKNIENFDLLAMKKSNALIEQSLEKNYRLIPAYLTLSYNYEFIEKYESALRVKKRSFLVSLIRTTVAPVKSLVYWITFQKEKTPQQWFEKAIDVLTTAIGLNDERQNPVLESELALNLAANYYNLEEFGFEKAYHYYQIKLQYDSTFASPKLAADVYKRMGHCALVVEDFEKGPIYLKRAIGLYRDLGDKENWLLNIKRLALLYQIGGIYDESVDYFKMAAEQDEQAKRENQLVSDYRNIAYNYQLMNDEEEAIKYANKALQLIRQGKVDEVKVKPNWIKIGILGIDIPIWNLGQIGAGSSTAAGGFTTEEEIALLYSILGEAALEQRSIADAINYLNKKIEIYRQRKDKIAEAIFLNNIAYLYYWDFNYTNAWDYFIKSLNICKKETIIPGILINTLNLASLSIVTNKLPSMQSLSDSAQQIYINKSEAYLTSSMDYLHFSLSLYENEPIGFLREQAQLYNLLGNLHYLKNLYLPDSLRSNQFSVIQQQVARLEDLATADSCYRYALELARTNNFKIDQILILQNMGFLSLEVGDAPQALDQFNQARDLAIEQNLSAWLWRIDLVLGQTLNSNKDLITDSLTKGDDYFYLNEAISVVEQNTLQLQTFRVTPFYRNQIRLLYQAAIDYNISQGKIVPALRLTEQYHGKQFLDIIGSHKIELKKERHKIYLGNARFLAQEINTLENKIRMAKEKADKPVTEITSWLQEKRELETEYSKLVQDLKSEDPELETFVIVAPVTETQIQKILNKNSIIVDYFISSNNLYIWTLTSDSVEFFTESINKQQLEDQIDWFTSELSNKTTSELGSDMIYQILIQPIADKINSYKNVIIVLDDVLRQVPFSYFINFGPVENTTLKTVVTVPGLSNYFYSYQKRKIRSMNLLWAGGELNEKMEESGYNVVELTAQNNNQDRNQYKARLQAADLIYLEVDFHPNDNDPLISTVTPLFPSQSPSYQVREFYNFDLKSSLVILNGLPHGGNLSVLALQKALLYAGSPSLILPLWRANNPIFWEYFFENLIDYPAAEALVRTQLKLRQAGYSSALYAGYQFIGFEGMSDEQERLFAEQTFVSKVAIGNRYAEDHDWEGAVTNYEQALIMAKKQGDLDSMEKLYQLIIESSASGHLYDKAIAYQLEFLEIARANQDIQKTAEGYNYLVYFYTEVKNFEQAAHYQNEYLKLAEKYDLRAGVAGSYRNLGLVYERSANYREAVNYFTKAIPVYREIGDSINVANCLKDRGRIYLLHLDNYSQAIENQEQALTIFQSQNETKGALETLQNLGFSHERLANYQVALNYQLQAFQLAQRSEDSYWIALSQQYLANVTWKMGNYEQALRYQKQAQQTFATLNDLKLQSVALATEGLILMSLGNLEEGINKEEQALVLAQKINARQDMGTIYKNLGLMYRAQMKWNAALEQFQQALQIDKAIDSRSGMGYGYLDIGSIYLQQGKIDEALIYFREALKIGQAIFDGRAEVLCLYQIGSAYVAQNKLKFALDTLATAADWAEHLFIPEVEWRSRRLIAQIYRDTRNLEQSLTAYHQALSIIETMRSWIKVEEYKSGFIDDKLDVYYDLVNLYLQLGQPARALEIVERARSRNFIDLLANRDIKFHGKVNKERLKQGDQLQNEMRRIQNEISGLAVKGEKITIPEKEQLKTLEDQLTGLKQQYQKFLIELKEQNTELSEMITVAPQNMDSLKTILPESVVMLEYFYTTDKLYIWVITNQQITVKLMTIPATELIAQVDLFRAALKEQKPILGVSQSLYNLLIGPVESWIARFNHLVIVPHGILHYLPYAALMNSDQKYLIEQYSMSLAPSATVLDICMKKGDPFISNKNWTRQVLALGNPNLNNPQLELPLAEKEIESVELLYPKVTAYLQDQATETVFKASCERSNLILLSCHGEFDAANPLFSSLLLSADAQNDGRLQAYEIFGLNMNTYLVALSACETGLAKISVGDEVIGLSRSFIYAGSSSLLSSLWKVDDLATAVLIKRFFRYLREGNSRARALQLAINLVRSEINVHPVYWAAFNLTGDFR